MKNLKLLAVGIVLLVFGSAQAQVSVSVNIGSPPAWGPRGYAEVEYYYLPDVQAYYDIRASQFVYFGNGNWVRSRYLPRQYRNYDLYAGHKVVLNGYHGNRPYAHFNNHKKNHHSGYRDGYHRPVAYKNYNDKRYYANNHRYSNDKRHYDNRKDHGKHDNRRNNRDSRNNDHGRH
ncbi:hypothetical protein ACMDB5_12355 [Flavobacterium sp. W1B]|uniref:hypothetical protein n=1 Tax=Flavobacterium sp. W1B TaxID=3394146 RepID=UPI0039BCEF1F